MHKQTTPCHKSARPSRPRSRKLLTSLTTLIAMGLAIGTPAAHADYTLYNDVSGWPSNLDISDNDTGFYGSTSGAIINSLRFDAPNGDSTVTINDSYGNNLVINSGTITVTSNAGSNGKYQRINGGGLTTANGNDLVITQNSTKGHLEIGSSIFGNINLVKSGSGFVDLTNHQAVYTGSTTINGGTLQISGADNLLPTGTAVTISSGTLSLNGHNQTVAGLVGTSSATIDHAGSGANTLTVNLLSGTNTYNGLIKNSVGSLGLTLNGSGILALTRLNTYTGVTIINGGTINAGVFQNGGLNSAIGSSSSLASNLVLNGGTLQYTSASAATTDHLFTLGDNGGTLEASGGTLKFSNAGAISFNNSASTTNLSLTLMGTSTGANTFNPSISDAGTTTFTSLNKSGSGSWILTNANSYTGGTNIQNGTLILSTQAGATVDRLASSGAVTLGKDANSGVLQLGDTNNPDNQTVTSLTTSGSGTTNAVIGGNAQNASVLTINNSTSDAYSGSIGGSTYAYQNNLALKKSGAGVLILFNSGTNTYTGGTTVSQGTVSGNANSYGSGAISVSTGAAVDYTQSATVTATNNISGTGNASFGGVATVNGNANPNGTGGTVNYTGTDSVNTTVQSGTLALQNPTGAALTGPVAVSTGGTLQLNSGSGNGTASGTGNTPFQIATTATTPTGAAVTLNGGTLSANGHSDGAINPTTAAVSSSMGALKLGAGTSQIDFGGMGGLLAFADSHSVLGSGNLNVINYTGSINALYIGTTNDLDTGELGRIAINGMGVSQLSNGRIIPAPTPEPSGMVTGLVGAGALGGVIIFRRRRAGRAITENG